MNQRIIYPTDDGGVAVLIPTGELAIEEVARKDVPAGVAYKIVDVADIHQTELSVMLGKPISLILMVLVLVKTHGLQNKPLRHKRVRLQNDYD